MIIGYKRVSTKEQSFDIQIVTLKKTGCNMICREVVSGARAEGQVIDEQLGNIGRVEILGIWKLYRLGRAFKHLVDLVNVSLDTGIGLKSIKDPIDTTTAQGCLVLNNFASLAEFERDLIRERTNAGLSVAQARGRKGG